MRVAAMRLTLVVLALTGAWAFSAAPAHADSGGPFAAGDGRANPLTADRVAVYCNHNNVVIWGIDNNRVGFELTTFTRDELTRTTPVSHTTPQGTVVLKLDQPAQTRLAYAKFDSTMPSVFTEVGAVYHIVWTGGSFGADGSAPFYKTFGCTYLP